MVAPRRRWSKGNGKRRGEEDEKTTSEWGEEQTRDLWREERARGKKRNLREGLKIKMARIQRRFWETAFEIFTIFMQLPSLYVLRRFSMTVVNMMS